MQRKEAKLKIFERIGFAHWLMRKVRIPECTIFCSGKYLVKRIRSIDKRVQGPEYKRPKDTMHLQICLTRYFSEKFALHKILA